MKNIFFSIFFISNVKRKAGGIEARGSLWIEARGSLCESCVSHGRALIAPNNNANLMTQN